MPRTVFRFRQGTVDTDNIPRGWPASNQFSIEEWFAEQGLGDADYVNAIEVVETDERRTDVEVEEGKTPPHKLVAYVERFNTVHPRLRQNAQNVVLGDGLGGVARHFSHYEVTSIRTLLAQFTDEPERLDEHSVALPIERGYEVSEEVADKLEKAARR